MKHLKSFALLAAALAPVPLYAQEEAPKIPSRTIRRRRCSSCSRRSSAA
jgi:hypothetical protein